jgi:hypothetical protein
MDIYNIMIFFYNLLLESQGKAFTTILVLWTLFAIFYKLIIIGTNCSLSKMILEGLEINLISKTNLQTLSITEVCHNSNIPTNGHSWNVKNIFLAYWALYMMKVTVIIISIGCIIIALCFYCMYIAQPIKTISMTSIEEILRYVSFFFLLIYSIISFLKILSALHKIPIPFMVEHKDYNIILFSW